MLKKQTSKVQAQVSVDFPPLPRLPAMKISEDHAAMQAHQVALDSWYQSFRQVHLDKFADLQNQITSLKKG